MNELHIITAETPVGQFHMIAAKKGGADIVVASGFGGLDQLKLRLPPGVYTAATVFRIAEDHPYQSFVHDYFNGDKTALGKIPTDQPGGVFAKRAWDEMAKIPWGETISYKELARRAGNEAASRAAGAACGSNRLILLIPCHRILKSGGSLGGYVYGLGVKTTLLQHEGAILA